MEMFAASSSIIFRISQKILLIPWPISVTVEEKSPIVKAGLGTVLLLMSCTVPPPIVGMSKPEDESPQLRSV